ncbi:AraC family transcriptional regulator [Paenibacillus mendelii]|uniref:AraC family transcriptional regulator n=1 Tax=Paenibacillus mendelii TaxID=206163 RepID=A0ABV6JIT4_9BACL|nr:AraC family transcriptional regulator [Paenibacillus mendelii]MCQ6558752.1 AraC family transcriptional regulator [Paenibacillus mendelii]
MWIKKVDFMNIAPYVRYIQQNSGNEEYKVPQRIIYDHEIINVLEGTCVYWIEGKEYVLQAGDMLYMPPHTEHYCYVPAGENFHYYAVHFDWIYMGENLNFPEEVYTKWDYINLDHIPVQNDLLQRPIVEFAEVEIPYLTRLKEPLKYRQPFVDMLQCFELKTYGYHLAMRSNMLTVIRQLIAEIATNEGVWKDDFGRPHIVRVIQYMYKHYSDPIDIKDLAELVHLSPNYLRVQFKRATGKTILEFLNQLRIEKAKALLLERKYTVTEIGEMVGIKDIHYFSKLFKRMEGLSPKFYAHTLKTSAPT